MFGAGDTVGTIGTITDGVYNKQWIIYTISGNTYQLFPMKNLDTRTYDMHEYLYNTILPNLKKSGLNIIDCHLVSLSVYNDICSKTGKTSAAIAGGEYFWLTDISDYNGTYVVYPGGDGTYNSTSDSYGVRPLITVVKS